MTSPEHPSTWVLWCETTQLEPWCRFPVPTVSIVRMSGILWNTLVYFSCIYDESNRSCHKLICISFLLWVMYWVMLWVKRRVILWVRVRVMLWVRVRVMLRVIHVRVIVDSQSVFIVLRWGGYLVMFSAYIRRFLSPLSLSFFFLSSSDLLSSTIRHNYNKYYVHQPILSILSLSKKPHRELTG